MLHQMSVECEKVLATECKKNQKYNHTKNPGSAATGSISLHKPETHGFNVFDEAEILSKELYNTVRRKVNFSKSNPLNVLDPNMNYGKKVIWSLAWELTLVIVVKIVIYISITRSASLSEGMSVSKTKMNNAINKIPNATIRWLVMEVTRITPTLINCIISGIFLGICLTIINELLKMAYLWILGKFPTQLSVLLGVSEILAMGALSLVGYVVFWIYCKLHETVDIFYPLMSWTEFIDLFVPGVVASRERIVFFVLSTAFVTVCIGLSYSLFATPVNGSNRNGVSKATLSRIFKYEAFLVSIYLIFVFFTLSMM